jgi:hypothetical protein
MDQCFGETGEASFKGRGGLIYRALRHANIEQALSSEPSCLDRRLSLFRHRANEQSAAMSGMDA